MNKAKKPIAILALVFIISFGLYCVDRYRIQNNSQTQVKGVATRKIDVYQKITNNTNNQYEFVKFEIGEGKTALNLLEQTATVTTTGKDTNAYVTKINNVVADQNKKEFWAFYVNGKMAPVGAGSYQLKTGDKIEWKLENY